jgi:prepilin-type N-terminal cleavage/methylation domain-containing protein
MKTDIMKNQKGFTLVEIIAVLVILGILAAVAVPKFINLQEDARVKAASSAISETKARLSSAYGKYLLVNGKEPGKVSDICDGLDDTDILPKDGDGDVPMGADFTVGLKSTDSVATITVTVVQETTLTTPATGTWTLP